MVRVKEFQKFQSRFSFVICCFLMFVEGEKEFMEFYERKTYFCYVLFLKYDRKVLKFLSLLDMRR